jgi:RNA polymerase sigma-70 factor (ECF subfamily)
MEVSRTEQQQVVDRFLAALTSGDMQGLMDVLAPDVVLIADGGGLAQAVPVPVEGSHVIGRFLSRFRRLAPGAVASSVWINGAPAIRIDDTEAGATAISLVVENGRITRIFAVRNPHKLAHLDAAAVLSR